MKQVVFLLLMAVAAAVAHVPPYMAYHGQLAGLDGNPVPDSTYVIMFSIWHERTGGQLVWTETHEVQTHDGMFTVYLGR